MSGDVLSPDQRLIWSIIKELNEGWLNDDFAPLERYFHTDAVMVFPKFQGRVKGKALLIQSYKDFVEKAEILDYKQENCGVDVAGESAMAAYRFEMIYSMGGKRYHESGYDMFCFVRSESRWQIVWRHMSPRGC